MYLALSKVSQFVVLKFVPWQTYGGASRFLILIYNSNYLAWL